jgi:hypothetical protein
VVKKRTTPSRATATGRAKARSRPRFARGEEILRRAQIYLLFEAKCPMLWTVAGIREEKGADGSRRWIIPIHLRYPTGFEGYLGDLLYDGARFAELTDRGLMQKRAEQIAADPERERKWHEY